MIEAPSGAFFMFSMISMTYYFRAISVLSICLMFTVAYLSL